MIKSYNPIADAYFNINGITTKYLTTDNIYIDELLGDSNSKLTESTDWKTIFTEKASAVGTQTTVKSIIGFTGELLSYNAIGAEIKGNQRKFLTVTLTETGAAEVIVAGSTLAIAVKNAAGTTIETLNHTFAEVAASASEVITFIVDSLIAGTELEFTMTLSADGGTAYEATCGVVVEDIIDNSVAGAIFTIGDSVATTEALVSTIQLIDNNGFDITCRAGVEVFLCTDADTPAAAATIFAVSTDGALLGTLIDKSSLLILSEVDGDIGITVTSTTSSNIRVAVRLPNGGISMSSEPMVWTA